MNLEGFWEWALCFGLPMALLGFVVLATLTYLFEQLEAQGRVRGNWGYVSTPHVVDSAAYRSAPVRDTKAMAAPRGVVRLAAVGLSIALVHIVHGAIGVMTSIDGMIGDVNEGPTDLLRYLLICAVGAGLMVTSARFVRHRALPPWTTTGVQLFHTVACALTLLSACSHGGGRELAAPLLYGVAWLVVVAMWLSPFRAVPAPS